MPPAADGCLRFLTGQTSECEVRCHILKLLISVDLDAHSDLKMIAAKRRGPWESLAETC